jgi:hypothetical protein
MDPTGPRPHLALCVPLLPDDVINMRIRNRTAPQPASPQPTSCHPRALANSTATAPRLNCSPGSAPASRTAPHPGSPQPTSTSPQPPAPQRTHQLPPAVTPAPYRASPQPHRTAPQPSSCHPSTSPQPHRNCTASHRNPPAVTPAPHCNRTSTAAQPQRNPTNTPQHRTAPHRTLPAPVR